jgi:hypothetical protein
MLGSDYSIGSGNGVLLPKPNLHYRSKRFSQWCRKPVLGRPESDAKGQESSVIVWSLW